MQNIRLFTSCDGAAPRYVACCRSQGLLSYAVLTYPEKGGPPRQEPTDPRYQEVTGRHEDGTPWKRYKAVPRADRGLVNHAKNVADHATSSATPQGIHMDHISDMIMAQCVP
jgi:hypothetical protein